MIEQIKRPNLVLALGNDLLGDDGVGFLAARALRGEFECGDVVVVDAGDEGLVFEERSAAGEAEDADGASAALTLLSQTEPAEV